MQADIPLSLITPPSTDEASGCCGGDTSNTCGCSAEKDVNELLGDVQSAGPAGAAYWRSFAEYAQTQEHRDALLDEVANYDPDELRQMSRRKFLKIMAASMALAGVTLTGCRRWPEEEIVPFSFQPEGMVPGEAMYYASVTERAGVGLGLLVRTVDGRPIKLEGNPGHPTTLGATDPFTQSSTLELYDPERPRQVSRKKGSARETSSWEAFESRFINGVLADADPSKVAVLAEPSSSSTLAALRAGHFAAAQWYHWTPLNHDSVQQATRQAFGQPMRVHYDLAHAERIVSFAADLLGDHPNQIANAKGWAKGKEQVEEGVLNRLTVFEAAYSQTGAAADTRMPTRLTRMGVVMSHLANAMGVPNIQTVGEPTPEEFTAIGAVASDLQSHRGKSVVAAGASLPPVLHELAYAINAHLGNLGHTVRFTADPIADETTNAQQIAALTEQINAGEIEALIILGGNPAYDAPADLKFADAIASLDHAVHHSLFGNETSALCEWHLPESHFLEAWGDARGYDGTVSIQQPTILPLFASKSQIEVVAMLAGLDTTDGQRLVFDHFRASGATPTKTAWRTLLHDGVLADSAEPFVSVAGPTSLSGDLPEEPDTTFSGGTVELTLLPSPVTLDGRHANNAWLQELPQPMTKLTWDNALLISYADALASELNSGDVVELSVDGATVETPVFVLPGQVPGTATGYFGYGRTHAGSIGGHTATEVEPIGADLYPLTASASAVPGFPALRVAELKKTGKTHELAYTQDHHLVDGVVISGGGLVSSLGAVAQDSAQDALEYRVGKPDQQGVLFKEATLEDYIANPNFVTANDHGDLSLQMFDVPQGYSQANEILDKETSPERLAEMQKEFRHAWGMAIDLSICNGCNACVSACQAENNIPVVGKEEVLKSREMQWLRIDRYFKGDPTKANVEVVHQPVMCLHCENAPCETVCPFAATVHDTEGLNTMVYNRCAGTRYCSNNCPYKVRRYNYFDFHSNHPRGDYKPWWGIPDTQQEEEVNQITRMVHNPEVTVRMRGVMEKCTYCVQRIHETKSAARQQWAKGERENEMITDGDGLQTACQQACATGAIVFGNLLDPDSKVVQMQKRNRAYEMLSENNTRPRTRYLAKITNPIVPAAGHDDHDNGH